MIVTVNLMMKSGAALTVYFETSEKDVAKIFESFERKAGLKFPFLGNKEKTKYTFVDLNEVVVIEIYEENTDGTN